MDHTWLAEQLLTLAKNRDAEQFAAGAVPAAMAQDLLSPGQLGALLRNPLLRYPQVRVAHSGRAVAVGEYVGPRRIGTRFVDDGIDAFRISQWLTRGATVTLDALEYLSAPVERICESLTQALGYPATATAYVTAPGRQGLSPHTDEEDVFVLQTYGTKQWSIDSGQRQDVATAMGFPMNDEMARVSPRLLRAGCMFYMPAGTPHVASAQNDLSIHITFSVERPRMKHLLTRAVEAAASSIPELNRLRGWDATDAPNVHELLRLVGSAHTDASTAGTAATSHASPFDSWDSLHADRLSLALTAPMTVEETADGYSLGFSEFRMKVSRSAGKTLAALEHFDAATVDSADAELREILFQLIGRGVIQASAVAG